MKRRSRAAGRWSGLWRARLGRTYYAAHVSAGCCRPRAGSNDPRPVSPPLTPPNASLPPPNLISSMRAEDDESPEGEGHAEDEDNAAKRKILRYGR